MGQKGIGNASVRRRDVYAVMAGIAVIFLIGTYVAARSAFPGLYGGIFSDDRRSSGRDDGSKDASSLILIDPQSLSQKIANGDPVRILDLRPQEAFRREHIRGSMSASFPSVVPEEGTLSVLVLEREDEPAISAIADMAAKHPGAFAVLDGGVDNWRVQHHPTVSMGDPESFVDQSKVYYISQEELRKTLESSDESVFLIDVQDERSFRDRHISGAMNMPLERIEQEIDTVKPPLARMIVVYGSDSVESFQAGVRISDLGAFAVRTLEGDGHLTSKSGLPLDSFR